MRCIIRFYCITLLLCGPAFASGVAETLVVLPVDEAFEVSARREGGAVEVRFGVADGHYLYRDRLSVLRAGNAVGLSGLPSGAPKEDPYFGRVQVLEQGFSSTFTVGDDATFTVRYQGCAEAGFCYPPQRREFRIEPGDTSLHISRDPGAQAQPLPF